MNTEFVPHKQALALKELGFDEPCFGWYSEDGTFYEGKMTIHQGLLLAPLYQQAFRWFREKYGLHQNITQYYGERFYFKIEDMFFPRRYEDYPIEKLRDLGEYVSQEETELECLKKLIEIVKQQL